MPRRAVLAASIALLWAWAASAELRVAGEIATRDWASVSPGAPTIERNPAADEGALVVLCMTSLVQGKLSSAEQACNRAILLKPTDPQPRKFLGAALLLERRYKDARYEFGEAIRLSPRDPGNRVGLGEALRGEGDFAGAVESFTQALALAPRDAVIWNARCWTRGLFARQLREGLKDCDTALALAPGRAEALDSRGLIELRLGDLAGALRDYDKALAAKADLPTALYGKGVAELKLGRAAAGRRDIARARALDANIDAVFVAQPLLPAPAANPRANPRGPKPPPSSRSADANSPFTGRRAHPLMRGDKPWRRSPA